MKKKNLFVCLGNICRSPLAEGIFIKLLKNNNLTNEFEVDSAGTAAYHVGEKPDIRMINTAEKHGVYLNSRARQVVPIDFDYFNFIFAMDKMNYKNLKSLAEKYNKPFNNVFLLRSFDDTDGISDVPDPYYGSLEDFENVFTIVEHSCVQVLKFINEN